MYNHHLNNHPRLHKREMKLRKKSLKNNLAEKMKNYKFRQEEKGIHGWKMFKYYLMK